MGYFELFPKPETKQIKGDFIISLLEDSKVHYNAMANAWMIPDYYVRQLIEGNVEPIKFEKKSLLVDKVIFNPPATIIKWKDGTKTIVKCQGGEPYDPEKGFALCFVKRVYGNNARYYTIMKSLIDKEFLND